MLKGKIIQKQEKNKLVNPMLFITERLTNEGERFKLHPVYLTTDAIMDSVLKSDEIYNRNGEIPYNIRDNIHMAFCNRINFSIRDTFSRIVDQIRVELINNNEFEDNFKGFITEICAIGIGLFIDKNMNYSINKIILPLLKLGSTTNIYSIDLIVSEIVETIYNKYMMEIENRIFYFKTFSKLNADQYSILYDIPAIITIKFGRELACLLYQFIDYKQEKMELIKPKSLKPNYIEYDDTEEI